MSGTEYTLSVSDDGLTLKATAGAATQNVAVIDADGVVTYQNTDFAKDLLNIASHNSVPSAGFYAWINIKATTGECALELPITNGEYMAYFLRPIDVIAGEGKFQDAVDNGSTVNIDVYKRQAKVSVTGYADKETGNPNINMTLSEKRAKNVIEMLKAKGVVADRIVIGYKGDTVQPYQKPEENRVCICIAE